MKILWMSDSPLSPSGLGTATRYVCAGLAARGHDVSIIGWQTERPRRWRRCRLYPVGRDEFGSDVLRDYVRFLRPDVLVTFADPIRLQYLAQESFTRFRQAMRVRWVSYYPIAADMGRLRLPAAVVRLLAAADLPITQSRYTESVSRANGVRSLYIPTGVDTTLFHVAADKDAAKRAVGYERRFVVLTDARNQLRKMLPRTLEIFRRFADDKPDALLHLHCVPNDPASRHDDYCYNLRADVAHLGLTDKVRFTRGMSLRRGASLARLAALYRAADVHLLTSAGEGFGIPTLQAAASGVVPLATDYAGNRELVRGHGEAIKVRRFVHAKMATRAALVDIDAAVRALDRFYYDRPLLVSKAAASRRFAEPYAWQGIVDRWDAALLALASPTPGRSRASRRFAVARAIGARRSERASRDARRCGALTIPVTLPPVDDRSGPCRVTGRVYAAGTPDVAVADRLRRIFPGLTVWSSAEWPAVRRPASKSRRRPRFGAPAFRARLASSTLALDLGGLHGGLPALAAELGVPCIAVASSGHQRRLWPALSLAPANLDEATQLSRWMLTDAADAADVTARARTRLPSARHV